MEIAAMRLAASAVSPILTKLGDTAASYFGGDITDEEVKHLQNIILPKIRNLLKVAEVISVDELKPWLRTLEDAAYEAEDVLDKYEYKRLEAEVSSLPKSLKNLKKKAKDFVAALALKTELKKSIEKLQNSADESDKMIPHYDINCQIPRRRDNMQSQQQQWPSTGLPPPSSVFGRVEERELLVNTLILTTAVEHSGRPRHTPVLAICGLGGAGKTTLAQCVYNDSRVVEHFGTRMWVHVSRKFDVHKITTQIIESATKGEGSSTITNLDALQMKLKESLKSSKKFLLVLDDVWCSQEECMQWDQMLAPLNKALDIGSRILVTTRTEEVASGLGIKNENVVQLKDLEYEHCMSIFKHYSFGDANIVIHDPEIATVAEQLMEKLKKSPLSARMVGSALRGKTNVADWEWILKKDMMLKDTLDVLYLSFDNLAPYLQRCFAYCSLYPKGHHFFQKSVDDLVRLWIAQGFVEAPYNNNMTVEDMGMQHFNELVSNSFFQMHTTFGCYYVIHDLLHDLAENVSKGYCFRIDDDCEDIPTTVRHLSIYTKDPPSHILPHIFKLVNLRTFMINRYMHLSHEEIKGSMFEKLNLFQKKMFEKFKKLRILSTGFYRWGELHKSVDQLIHLRYLQVHNVVGLPESLGRLYHLQFLDHRLEGYEIGKVPENLSNLIKLRYLQEKISEVPLFGKLESLQYLEEYSVSRKKGHEIGQLKNLRHIRGSLRINNLEIVRNKAEASEASLKEKKLLKEMHLAWTHSPERDGRIDEEVIEGLVPPPNLKVLTIDGYNGIKFPIPHFLHLSVLSIDECPKLERVPSLPSTLIRLQVSVCENLNEMSSLPLGLRVVRVEDCRNLMQLSPLPPNLEMLYIRTCPGVETLLSNILLFEGEDEHPNQNYRQHFPLKYLTMKSCSVSGKKRLFSDPNKVFPSLTRLCLEELPWLTSLFHPDHKLTSLESIDIGHCENLELFGSPLASASSLRRLSITNCPRMTMQNSQQPDMDGSFGHLPSSLEALEFRDCGDPGLNLLGRCLIGLSHCPEPTSLAHLLIEDCPNLTSLPANIEKLSSLSYLSIVRCSNLRSMPANIEKLSSLTDLRIEDCPNLTTANIEKLSSLRDLRIWQCPMIELLPNLPSSLERLWILGCHPQLIANYEEDGPLRHKLHHITDVNIRQ